MLWEITPLFAEWLGSRDSVLFSSGLLTAESAVLELGCGISALTGLVVGPLVSTYVLTDQPYVSRLVERNLSENLPGTPSRPSNGKKKSKRLGTPANPTNLRFTPLDWEADQPTPSLTGSPDAKSFDAVIACDCIYNEALIQPLVQTFAAACDLRTADLAADASRPCVCIVAQQLRNPEVFEAWLESFRAAFRVWRVPDSMLPVKLRSGSGFVIHLGVLRSSSGSS